MRTLIVDGHSVIFAWPELRTLHARRTALAREELVKVLTQYQDASGVHVVVVFDGKGAKLSDQTVPGGIQIFYSGSTKTADDIVERLVAKYAPEREITVATSDRLEQQTVVSFGATVVSAEGLRDVIGVAAADLARKIEAHRRGRQRRER
jgi:predicted RNA-binding protein with PIN domain